MTAVTPPIDAERLAAMLARYTPDGVRQFDSKEELGLQALCDLLALLESSPPLRPLLARLARSPTSVESLTSGRGGGGRLG